MSVSEEHLSELRRLISAEMMVESVIIESEPEETLRVTGRLNAPAEDVFNRLRPPFEVLGHTPFLRRDDDGQDIIVAVQKVFRSEPSSSRVNAIMFALTVLSVLLVGVTNNVESPPITLDKAFAALPQGVLYMVSLLGILGAHEMGHYIMARRHGVQVTLPYFIPFPTLLGTLGAVIAMKEPAPNRRIQFDIGVAGPLAGLVLALPITFIGLMLSEVLTLDQFVARFGDAGLVQEGNSLVYLGFKYLIFGKVLPTPTGEDVLIHTMAWAGWAGLLVTALNLIPVGQLDGGHVLFGLIGKRAERVRWPAVMILLGLSFFYNGWLLWAAIIFFMARRNAPVFDEITGLGPRRRMLAIAMLVIFVLIFTPVPLKAVELPGSGPELPAARLAGWIMHQ